MDKRTRVLAAMNGEKVDHVPVGFWFHFGGDEAMGEACVNAHLKYYRLVGNLCIQGQESSGYVMAGYDGMVYRGI